LSDGLTFHVGGTAITLTSLALAAIVGIVLNAILPGNEYSFESSTKQNKKVC
jgi:uracil permease